MKIISLSVKNYVKFKEATLPLDRIGVTKITGKNLDSNTKLAPAGDDTNAVGKTALLSGIPQLVFASNPMTQEIKTKAKKDAFKRKDASIILQIETKDNKRYTLEKKTNGKSTQFVIHEGEENLNVRTQAYPEEKIRQMFDMTEDEFYTLWFISSSKPSKIQYGSAASRLQFFTNFFRLNNYDEIRKIFNGLLRKAKDAKIALTEVATHIESLNVKDQEYISRLKSELSELKEKSQAYSKNYSELHATQMDLSFIEDSKDLFSRWEKAAGKMDTATSKDIKKIISKAARIVEQSASYESYLVKRKVYEKEKQSYTYKRNKYKQQLTEVTPSTEKPKNFSAELTKLNDEISKLSQKKSTYEEELAGLSSTTFDKAAYKAAKEKIKGLDYNDLLSLKEDAASKYAVAVNTKRSLKELVKHSSCPTCSHKIDKSLYESLYKKACNDVDKYTERLSDLRKKISNHETSNQLEKAKEDYDSNKHSIEALNDNIKAISKKLKAKQEEKRYLSEWETFFSIESKLQSLEKPKKPTAPKQFSYSEDELETSKEIASIGNLVLPNFERYYAIRKTSTGLTLGEVKQKTERLRAKMDKTNALIPKLTSKIDLAKQAIKEYEKLTDRKSELKEAAADTDVLGMLVDAYSNKGLKLLLIKYIASVIEKNMNQYASLVYPEDVTFKFEVVNDREFNILRGSKRGTKIEYDDVRVLSGAESRAFSFLLPLAIMPLIPKERRLNVMVLDEPTNNMGAARMELFVKSFVPKLNQLVPHLVIISTSDESYKNSVSYQITKKDGKSKLNLLP